MKGLKINYNEKLLTIGQSTSDEIIVFIISIGKEDGNFKIDAGGHNPAGDYHFDWIKEIPKSNSKLTIDFLDKIEKSEISQPINVRHANSTEFINSEKVKYYHRLKKELEEKGLI